MFGKNLIEINSKEDYWDKRISYACFSYFLLSVANSTLKVICIDASSQAGRILSAIFGLLIVFSFLSCIKEVIKRAKSLLIKSYSVFFLLYVFSFLSSILRGEPTNLIINQTAFLTFAWWIPVGVFAYSVNKYEILYKTFHYGSYLLWVLLILMFVFHPLTIYGTTGYNMFFGFNFVIPTLFHLNEFFQKKNLGYFILIVIDLLLIIVYANRGALLPVFFFIVYKYFFDSKFTLSKVGLSILFCLSIVTFVFLGDLFLNSVALVLDDLGIQSRTLLMMLNGSVTDSTGRNDIWNECFNMIAEKPFWGWGMGGEYYRLAASAENVDVIDNSYHPHNSLIQHFVYFGVIGGLLVNLIFIYPFFKFKSISDKYRRNLVIIFAAVAIIPSFISASNMFIKPAVAIFLYLFYKEYRIKY